MNKNYCPIVSEKIIKNQLEVLVMFSNSSSISIRFLSSATVDLLVSMSLYFFLALESLSEESIFIFSFNYLHPHATASNTASFVITTFKIIVVPAGCADISVNVSLVHVV